MMNIIATLVGQAVKLHQVIEMEKDRLIGENVKLQEETQGTLTGSGTSSANSKKMQEVFPVHHPGGGKQRHGHASGGKAARARSSSPKPSITTAPGPEGPFRARQLARPSRKASSSLSCSGTNAGPSPERWPRKKGRFEQADKGTIFLGRGGGSESDRPGQAPSRHSGKGPSNGPWRPEHAAGGRAHHRLRRTRTWKMR